MQLPNSTKGTNEKTKSYKQSYFGLGLGFDYGGIGLKAEYLPSKYIGLLVGFGYNLVDPAYNLGLSFKALPGKKVTPIIIAMYGYNAFIKIKNAAGNISYSKTYYGATVGAGADIKFGRNSNKISLALLAPFRHSAFHNDYDGLKDAGYKFEQDILPVAFSVGVNFAINKNNK